MVLASALHPGGGLLGFRAKMAFIPMRRPHSSHSQPPNDRDALVQTNGALEDLVGNLYAAGRFAFDSEFIGESSYFPKLCLLQVATEDRLALIDPLADLDLAPFWELVCSPSVEKIVHAGEQDLEAVGRLWGDTPTNVFDTQIAAGFLGMPYPISLTNLVLDILGEELGKSHAYSQWDHRPLSANQLGYAADDVRYLPPAYHKLVDRLVAADHLGWAREASEEMSRTATIAADSSTQFRRIRGAQSLDPRELAVLRELAAWRDRRAREQDMRPRTLLRDEVLIDLARDPVRSVPELTRIRGLPRSVEARFGSQIVEAVNRGLALPPEDLPAGRERGLGRADRPLADALWASAQRLCADQGIDTALVMNRQEIVELCRLALAGKSLGSLRIFKGWRAQACGNQLRGILQDLL